MLSVMLSLLEFPFNGEEGEGKCRTIGTTCFSFTWDTGLWQNPQKVHRLINSALLLFWIFETFKECTVRVEMTEVCNYLNQLSKELKGFSFLDFYFS